MWGWTGLILALLHRTGVFPTHVGVDRQVVADAEAPEGIPHACGGGPLLTTGGGNAKPYSPRMWGWTVHPAGMPRLPQGIPHACGGGPLLRGKRGWSQTYSPRMWGWTVDARRRVAHMTYSPRMWGWTEERSPALPACAVFPTHVGVDRLPGRTSSQRTRIPHACGGGPDAGLPKELPG